jgi:branched-chain amino acid aminotransferase
MNVPSLQIERVRASRCPPATVLGRVAFSTLFSDHMLVAEYRDGAWQEATIRAYGTLALPPSISSLQYGLSVFEGLKAQRTPAGHIALFRPRDNARRLNRSAARLAMPEVPEEFFVQSLRELVRLDQDWVPPCGLGALYIRPTLFSIDPSIRVNPAERYLFVVFTLPFGSYYTGAVDALVSDKYVRAFPGGTGDVKTAGNYAAGMLAEREAREAGFHTVLWLDGRDHSYVEECGVMNAFFVIGDTVITPALEGTALAGITRDSAIVMLREMGVKVDERRISIDEIFAAHDAGQLRECFGTGTAATLSHIGRLRARGRTIELPPVGRRVIAQALRERLIKVATGQSPDTHSWLDIIQCKENAK